VLDALGRGRPAAAVAGDVGGHAKTHRRGGPGRGARDRRSEGDAVAGRRTTPGQAGQVDVGLERAAQLGQLGRDLQHRVHAVRAGKQRRGAAVQIAPAEAGALRAGGPRGRPVGPQQEAAQQAGAAGDGRALGQRRRDAVGEQAELVAAGVHEDRGRAGSGEIHGEPRGGVPVAGRRLVQVEGEQRAEVAGAGRRGPAAQRRRQVGEGQRVEQRTADPKRQPQSLVAPRRPADQLCVGKDLIRSE